MNWDQARSAELGTANRQDGVFEAHVTRLEVQRFADAQAGNAEQTDEANGTLKAAAASTATPPAVPMPASS